MTLGGMERERVVIYTTDYCGYCRRAKQLLTDRGIGYTEVDVTEDPEQRAWLAEKTGRRTVPQIFINEEPIGGYDDLVALARAGKLS